MAAFVEAMLASRVSGKFLDGGICGSNAGVEGFRQISRWRHLWKQCWRRGFPANFSMAAFVEAMLASRVSGKFLDGGICGSNAGVEGFRQIYRWRHLWKQCWRRGIPANLSMAAFVEAMLASRVSGKFIDGGICGSNAATNINCC